MLLPAHLKPRHHGSTSGLGQVLMLDICSVLDIPASDLPALLKPYLCISETKQIIQCGSNRMYCPVNCMQACTPRFHKIAQRLVTGCSPGCRGLMGAELRIWVSPAMRQQMAQKLTLELAPPWWDLTGPGRGLWASTVTRRKTSSRVGMDRP